jgi:signal peptidase I
MEPTLAIGQRVLVDRLTTHPRIGDVVVFHPPHGADVQPPECGDPQQGLGHSSPCDTPTAAESGQTFVKRVVGLPGDRLAIRDGKVIRNGVRERTPQAQPCGDATGCDFDQTITVPKGDYFMMGDNRGDSDDSRFWGPVPQRRIIGEAFATYWPPGRIGGV